MDKITNKQLSYISYLLENHYPNLFAEIPRYDAAHPEPLNLPDNIKPDYRRKILEDYLLKFTKEQASRIIETLGKFNNEQEIKILFDWPR